MIFSINDYFIFLNMHVYCDVKMLKLHCINKQNDRILIIHKMSASILLSNETLHMVTDYPTFGYVGGYFAIYFSILLAFIISFSLIMCCIISCCSYCYSYKSDNEDES